MRQFDSWGAFWNVVDRMNKPAAGGLGALAAQTVKMVQLLLLALLYFFLGVLWTVYEILLPVIRLLVLVAVIGGLLHWFGVVDMEPYIPPLPDFGDENPAEADYSPPSPEADGYGAGTLLLAAILGALAALAGLRWFVVRAKAREEDEEQEFQPKRRRG